MTNLEFLRQCGGDRVFQMRIRKASNQLRNWFQDGTLGLLNEEELDSLMNQLEGMGFSN